MDYEGSMQTAEEDVVEVVQPTDRRPDFCAEALSPGARLILIASTMFLIGLVVFFFASAAIWPGGLYEVSQFAAVELTGVMLALGFFVLLFYGALLGNNPRLNKVERIMWYLAFGLAGPFALPAYFIVHVWPVPYQPTSVQKL